MNYQSLLPQLKDIAQQAGDAILDIYNKPELSDTKIQDKEDRTPLTEADLASHRTIVENLEKLTPEIPILSEESAKIEYSVRKEWSSYWLIDPLDGTKEFLNRNGEFTVNIAFIEKGIPVMGIVFVPVSQTHYFGFENQAYKQKVGEQETLIRTRSLQKQVDSEKKVTLVASRRHGTETLQQCVAKVEKQFGNVETTSIGSSLKICLVAEGEADLYPRLAPTSEWDTAAAQAVLEAAGGFVVDTEFKTLRYNQKENILNPHFYVIGDPQYAWKDILLESH